MTVLTDEDKRWIEQLLEQFKTKFEAELLSAVAGAPSLVEARALIEARQSSHSHWVQAIQASAVAFQALSLTVEHLQSRVRKLEER